MIQDFLMCNTLELRHSASESRRFGFEVARLLVPAGNAFSDEEIMKLIGRSGGALIILRAETSREALFAGLKSLNRFECIHADNLVYYHWGVPSSDTQDMQRTALEIDDRPSWSDIERVLTDSFRHYRNHYSANPRLSSSVTLSGYQEWAAELLRSSDTLTLVTRDNSQATGFLMISLDPAEGVAEIPLNAVHSSAQRAGVYSALMREARRRLALRGDIHHLYISTQSENRAVISAWEKLGLTPRLSLSTFHLMFREAFGSTAAR
jgi:ribosomal protein S18 acetylase RimI-like enzyme